MPGKPDFTKLVTLYTKVCGGEPAPGQTLGAQLGPLGCVSIFQFSKFIQPSTTQSINPSLATF